VHGVSAAVRPDLFAGFLRNAARLDDRGSTNPAALALIRDGGERLAGGQVPGHLDMVAYGLWVVLVGLALLSVARRPGLAGHLECVSAREGLLFAAFFAFSLAAPRFKDYSYILLIPPSVYVVVRVLRGLAPRLAALALLSTHFFAYQSWVAALVLFTVCLAHPRGPGRRPPAPVEEPGPA
jgi:hypothetical protein